MRHGILLAAVLLAISGVILATQTVAQSPPCHAPSMSAQERTPTRPKPCPTLEPGMEATPEDDWYRYQGDVAGDAKLGNAYCGQACVAMAIEKVTGKPIKIALIADHIGTGQDEETDSNDLKVAVDKWGVDYIPIKGMKTISQAVRDRGHIVIAVVKTSEMGEGPDCNGKGNSPEQHCHKYRSHSGGHWMVVHTLTDDAEWVIVHDPYVFRSPPDRTYWYSNGLAKGKNRYYLTSEFQSALLKDQPALEIVGPDWYRYQGEDNAGVHKDDNAYCGQTCVAMAIQYLKEQSIPISNIVSRVDTDPDQVLEYEDMKKALGDWEVEYEPIQDMEALRQAVQDRRNIALARIDMSKISEGSDFDTPGTDPRTYYGRYAELDYKGQQDHWVVVRGITEDGRWVIVHDPYVFYDDIYRYSMDRDMPKGRNRYYAYSEFESALASEVALEITGLARTGPSLAPALYKQSEFAILEPGEATEIYFILLNAGSQTWEAGRYALVNVNGQPLGARSQMALDTDVPPERRVTWRFSITAPAVPGVYRSEWRFSYDGHLIDAGPLLWTSVIVVPGDSGDLAEIIRSLIEDALQRGEEWLERQWEELRRRIIEMIEAEMERQVEEFVRELCGGPAATMILSLAVVWVDHRHSRVQKRDVIR